MTTEIEQKVSKMKGGFVRTAIIIAIVIVLNLFFNYTISLVYKAPQYDDYIKPTQVVTQINNKDDCLNVGGQWTDSYVPNQKADMPTGYCDANYTHQLQYNAAVKSYDRSVFIILVVFGIISLALGAFFVNQILAPAFSWGGVLSLLVASVRYWSDANNLFKVIILAMALGILIWVAIKKFGDKVS
ncbi:MAG: hypothetical protein WCO65_01315 [bacterium]